MAYTTLTDISFANAPGTSPGSGANSTTGVPGLIDLYGGVFALAVAYYGGANHTVIDCPMGVPLSDVLYASNSTAVQDGRVRTYSSDSRSQSKGGAFRYSPGNGGSGYVAYLFSNSGVFFGKRVNGTLTRLANNLPIGITLTGDFEVRATCQQTSPTQTTLTVSLYSAADPSTPLCPAISYVDNEPALQNVAGILGFSAGDGGLDSTRIVLEQAAAALSASAFTVVPYRTTAALSAQPATGGSGPLAYQYYRSSVAGFTPGPANLVPGATTLVYTDSGLAPATTYRYRLVVSDGGGATATYPEVSVTTFAAALSQSTVMVHAGDSISYGTGSSTLNAVLTEVANLNAAGIQAATLNLGQSGSTVGNWQKDSGGLGFYEGAVAQANRIGADCVSIMLGTNDSKESIGTSAAAYKATLQGVCTNLLADVPTLRRIVLNEPPYVAPGVYGDGTDYDAGADTRLQAYIAQLNTLDNGTTIRRGSRVTYAYFQAHPDQLADGVHPNQAGHTALGGQWSDAFQTAFPQVINVNVTTPFRGGFSF